MSTATITTPLRRTPRGATASRPRSVAMTTLFMAICAFYFLLPMWWLIVASSRTTGQLATDHSLVPSSIGQLFSNVKDVVTYDGGIFVRWLLNSIGYAVIGAAGATVIAAMAGYGLAKYVFPGREAVFHTILAGVLVPVTALAMPLFLMFSQAHAVNSYWSVLIPSLVSPFGVYLSRIYASAAVPDSLLEAARLDGASEVRTFFTMSARLMSPALVTIFLFSFVGIWNNFFLPLVMLQNQKLYPITLGLFSWNTQISRAPFLQTYVIVGSLLSAIPLLIAFLLLQRFWKSGLAEGAVKE
jgi:multiple sugar transport system permease protein